MSDSTVQVVGYWEKGEKQNYDILNEEYQIKGGDTISSTVIQYQVEISILDSTKNSYTIQWDCKNYDITSSNDKLQKLLLAFDKDISFVIRTDEMGGFVELVNWKEIQKKIKKTYPKIKKEFKDVPGMNKLVQQISTIYFSKEGLENNAINEILQFYTFHGVKYKQKEDIQWQVKTQNIYGGNPLDTDCLAYLDEIDAKENIYSMKLMQEVNKEQLLDAAYLYLSEAAKSMKVPFEMKREDLADIENSTYITSIIHETGWPVYSVKTTTVVSDKIMNIKKSTIQIK